MKKIEIFDHVYMIFTLAVVANNRCYFSYCSCIFYVSKYSNYCLKLYDPFISLWALDCGGGGGGGGGGILLKKYLIALNFGRQSKRHLIEKQFRF